MLAAVPMSKLYFDRGCTHLVAGVHCGSTIRVRLQPEIRAFAQRDVSTWLKLTIS